VELFILNEREEENLLIVALFVKQEMKELFLNEIKTVDNDKQDLFGFSIDFQLYFRINRLSTG
jgi:hypothetical protein